jgi:hypothetical protein
MFLAAQLLIRRSLLVYFFILNPFRIIYLLIDMQHSLQPVDPETRKRGVMNIIHATNTHAVGQNHRLLTFALVFVLVIGINYLNAVVCFPRQSNIFGTRHDLSFIAR